MCRGELLSEQAATEGATSLHATAARVRMRLGGESAGRALAYLSPFFLSSKLLVHPPSQIPVDRMRERHDADGSSACEKDPGGSRRVS